MEDNQKDNLIICLLGVVVGALIVVIILTKLGITGICGCKVNKNEVKECPKCEEKSKTNPSMNSQFDDDIITTGDITNNEKEEVTRIIGLTPYGIKRIKKDTLKSMGYTGINYADINNLTLSYYFLLPVGNYLTTDLNNDVKKMIIQAAAQEYKYDLISIDYNGLNDNSKVGLSVNDYKKIAPLYNFSDDGFEIFDRDKDYYKFYYLFDVSGSVINPIKVEDEISFRRTNNGIVVNYYARLNEVKDDNFSARTYKYTFRKHDDGSYYLYSIRVSDN